MSQPIPVFDLTLVETVDEPQDHPLGPLNVKFHELLHALREEQRALLDDGSVPVIVRMDDRMLLCDGALVSSLTINTPQYHRYKALAHLPLVLVLAMRSDRSPVDAADEMRVALRDLRADPTVPHVPSALLEAAMETLLEKCGDGPLTFDAVRVFNNSLQPAFHQLLAWAAREEAEQSLQALQKLEAIVDDPSRWSNTCYVVCAGHQPRYKQLAKQFFKRWVYAQTQSQAEVAQRVLYGEGLESAAAARDLVVERLVNSIVGDAFLHSPLSMNQDVLGEAGKIALDNLFAGAGIETRW